MQALSLARSYSASLTATYSRAMETIADVRRANLNLLLDECGSGRGSAATLSRLTGVPAPMISQLRRVTYYPNGVERTMGDDVARQLEKGMKKKTGWMDHPHDVTRDADELDHLQNWRLLTPEQREHVAATVKLLLATTRPPDDDPGPRPNTRPSPSVQ